MSDPSLWSFISNADLVVKLVMLILLLASIASWAIIMQRVRLLKQANAEARAFEQRFWSGIELNQLYQAVDAQSSARSGLAAVFHAGFSEFKRLQQQPNISANAIMEGAQRAMRVAIARDVEVLERQVSLLATIGSTSPYVGLFGTVWGIMSAFRALGSVQQATIAMVAPGISEALIATAIGLFAAIPAVIAYNRFSNRINQIFQQYELFQEELCNILHREAHGAQTPLTAPQEAPSTATQDPAHA